MSQYLHDLELLALFQGTQVPSHIPAPHREASASDRPILDAFGPLLLTHHVGTLTWIKLKSALYICFGAAGELNHRKITSGWGGLNVLLIAFKRLEAIHTKESVEECREWLENILGAVLQQCTAHDDGSGKLQEIIARLSVPKVFIRCFTLPSEIRAVPSNPSETTPQAFVDASMPTKIDATSPSPSEASIHTTAGQSESSVEVEPAFRNLLTDSDATVADNRTMETASDEGSEGRRNKRQRTEEPAMAPPASLPMEQRMRQSPLIPQPIERRPTETMIQVLEIPQQQKPLSIYQPLRRSAPTLSHVGGRPPSHSMTSQPRPAHGHNQHPVRYDPIRGSSSSSSPSTPAAPLHYQSRLTQIRPSPINSHSLTPPLQPHQPQPQRVYNPRAFLDGAASSPAPLPSFSRFPPNTFTYQAGPPHPDNPPRVASFRTPLPPLTILITKSLLALHQKKGTVSNIVDVIMREYPQETRKKKTWEDLVRCCLNTLTSGDHPGGTAFVSEECAVYTGKKGKKGRLWSVRPGFEDRLLRGELEPPPEANAPSGPGLKGKEMEVDELERDGEGSETEASGSGSPEVEGEGTGTETGTGVGTETGEAEEKEVEKTVEGVDREKIAEEEKEEEQSLWSEGD